MPVKWILCLWENGKLDGYCLLLSLGTQTVAHSNYPFSPLKAV